MPRVLRDGRTLTLQEAELVRSPPSGGEAGTGPRVVTSSPAAAGMSSSPPVVCPPRAQPTDVGEAAGVSVYSCRAGNAGWGGCGRGGGTSAGEDTSPCVSTLPSHTPRTMSEAGRGSSCPTAAWGSVLAWLGLAWPSVDPASFSDGGPFSLCVCACNWSKGVEGGVYCTGVPYLEMGEKWGVGCVFFFVCVCLPKGEVQEATGCVSRQNGPSKSVAFKRWVGTHVAGRDLLSSGSRKSGRSRLGTLQA